MFSIDKKPIKVFILFLLFLAVFNSCNQTEEKPNIILILLDDMGYGDPGCYNPDSKIPTPTIDRLASEGILFTDAHATGPLCHPSRYGLMRGRYPWRTDVSIWRHHPTIEEDRMTLPSM